MSRPDLPISVIVSEDGGETLQEMTNAGVKIDGVELRITDWSGWTETPGVRANPEDVPAGDGAYDDGPYWSARTLTLKGVAYADTPAALMRTERVFNRLLAGEIRRGAYAVTQVGIGNSTPGLLPDGVVFPSEALYPSAGSGDPTIIDSRQCSVRLGGPTIFTKTHPQRAEWSMALYAKDPRRYSTELKVGGPVPRYTPSGGLVYPRTFPRTYGTAGTAGRITVVNNGDIPTGVELEIVGGCLNPKIVLVETGQRIALQANIDANVVIDTNTTVRSVLRDGAPFGWVLTSDSEFFQLPKGTSTLLFLADSGSALLTARWRDATP